MPYIPEINPPKQYSPPVAASSKKAAVPVVLVILAGILSGFLLSRLPASYKSPPSGSGETGGEVKKVVGMDNPELFKDSAEGVLEEGGLNGEGTHKLIRPGGDSQTVYLTSSVLDLSEFTGKKIRVWGSTQAAQIAGWFTDVGKVELLE